MTNLPESVVESIRPSTCLITVMLANNETGIMFSVAHIGRLVAVLFFVVLIAQAILLQITD